MNIKKLGKYFVTGIDTDSGKSLISAILTESLSADYWKPVQAGAPTDSDYIREHVRQETIIHPEAYNLKTPMSPHCAADIEGISLSLDNIQLPQTDNDIIVEGAGGIMVPLNAKDLVIDIAVRLDLEVILVSRNYLGSINHTLLSINYLENAGVKIAGIIFNGPSTPSTEDYILEYSGLHCLAKIPQLEEINLSIIQSLSKEIKWPQL